MPTRPRPSSGVTIGDVAAAADVSRATVSRAFSRPELLRPETVDHVKAVAERLGYTANRAAQALSTGRFGNIAMVVPDVANPFFPPMVRTVQSRAEQADLAVFLGDADESAEREAKLAARFSPQVDGFILASPRLSAERIWELADKRPVVLVNRDVEGIPRVLIDSSGGMTEGVVHLKRLGHRRIAYLAGPRDSWSDQQRRSAITRAAAAAGMEVEVIEVGRPSYTAGRSAVSALVAAGATAAVAFDDVVSQGVLAGLELRDIAVPRDFSLMGCDDTLAALTTPAMTSVSAASAAAGTAAADLLVRMLETGRAEPERLTVATHLVVRATTGPAAG
ncbi:MAG: LacI family transcriptional regulator [Actinomycetia bacterium]|nr:LacI family transcriptional regulator [Actinomycetes bacterium]MCL2728710.1 LacI family transcriptional regulator [Actinomycetes bacterium]